MPFQGMDVGHANSVAEQLAGGAHKLEIIRQSLRHAISNLTWIGPDATAFHRDWFGQQDPAITELAALLRAGGEQLNREAVEQSQASGSSHDQPGACGGPHEINQLTTQSRTPPPGYVRDDVTAWQLADRFIAREGGKYWFRDGDLITEQIRRNDEWLQELTRQIQHGERPLSGEDTKSLANPKEFVRAALRDPVNIAHYVAGSEPSDSAVTYLGSYHVSWYAEPLDSYGKMRIVYDITNTTTGESASRIPPVGYLPERFQPPLYRAKDRALNEFFPTQAQRITMTVEA